MKNNKGIKATNPVTKLANLTPAKRKLMAGVTQAAFVAGNARGLLITRLAHVCGPTPSLELYNEARDVGVVGYMAAALQRGGDNRPDAVILADCVLLIDPKKYQGATGKGDLREGVLGRRTVEQERAYSTARVQMTGAFKAAGVTVPVKSGGNTATTRTPRPSKAQQAINAAVEAAVAKASKTSATPKLKAANDVAAQFGQEAKRLAALVNRNAKITPIEYKSIVEDFAAAVRKANAKYAAK